MAELPAGSTFAEHVILGVAGRGGMGVVYRARHLRLKREVALKVIAPEHSGDSAVRARFERECEAAASIHHANIIPIYHAGEEEGQLYLTMRYVAGIDLARLVAMEGRVDLIRATRLIAQVADALDAAHERGVVHRDVKPANVLLEGERALLTDFGLTKILHDVDRPVTDPGTLIGTFDYTAPEQLRGSAVDARTDVYALGCVLYETLTGQVPYPRPNTPAKLLAHMEAPPPSVTALLPDAPRSLDDVIERALAKDPEGRFASAGELARAATAATTALGGGPVAQSALASRRVQDPSRRSGAATAAPNGTAHVTPRVRRPTEVDPPARSARRVLATIAFVSAALAVLAITDWRARLDLATTDARFAVRGTRPPPSDVVVVAIDERALAELAAEWPVPRGLHARVIDLLARGGATVIVYNIAFVTPSNVRADNRLIEAVRRADAGGTHVVLAQAGPIDPQRGTDEVFGGREALEYSGAETAITTLEPDLDGVVRRIAVGAGSRSVPVVAAGLARGRAVEASDFPGGAAWIDFAGDAGTVTTVPFSLVVNRRIPDRMFRDKVVLVGVSAPSARDLHRTPVSKAMSGTEVMANEIATIRDGFPLRSVPSAMAVLLAFALALIPMLVWFWRGRTAMILLATVAAAAYATTACIAFAGGAVLPVADPLAALALVTITGLAVGRREAKR